MDEKLLGNRVIGGIARELYTDMPNHAFCSCINEILNASASFVSVTFWVAIKKAIESGFHFHPATHIAEETYYCLWVDKVLLQLMVTRYRLSAKCRNNGLDKRF